MAESPAKRMSHQLHVRATRSALDATLSDAAHPLCVRYRSCSAYTVSACGCRFNRDRSISSINARGIHGSEAGVWQGVAGMGTDDALVSTGLYYWLL